MAEKVCLGVDKAKWHTSPLPRHIALVSTINRRKAPNVAPKSWISMVAVKPAIIGFGCNLQHQTARNILETKEFVINIPGEDLAESVWRTGESAHGDASRIKKLGFTLGPSITVAVPRIEECKGHLECVYESDRRYGDEIWFFGEIVFACIDEKALKGSSRERYTYLNPIFYLEEKTYGTLDRVQEIQAKPVSTN
ncbi:MAG TPA: flavin reductase family protein [Candidatus Bathyarchaeia archaeon]|nr:flavin reductase family protein [Candidatus Bathyarchaeia archaeon]